MTTPPPQPGLPTHLHLCSILTNVDPSSAEPPLPRRSIPSSVQSQSKPVYPSYHLEPSLPILNKPRPTDYYRPLNILRYSPRPTTIRIPLPPPASPLTFSPTDAVPERNPQRPGAEEFIAVVFGNEVWMGLVDFKSEKSQSEDINRENVMDEEFGNSPSCLFCLGFVSNK